MSIQTTIATTQSSLANLGSKGEDLRLERSRSLTFKSKTYSKDLKTFQGIITGRDGTDYNPQIILGKGWTCDCTDHQNLLNGTRKCGKNTGEGYATSPCKHVLALARFSWVALGTLSKQVEKIQSIQNEIDNKE